MTDLSQSCPCGSRQALAVCCMPYLSGKTYARTPQKLMRSRYTAYALGRFGEYLYNTWHFSMRSRLSIPELNQVSCEWQALDIIQHAQKGNRGWVEFNAYYLNEGRRCVLKENSEFVREDGRWYYLTGEIEDGLVEP